MIGIPITEAFPLNKSEPDCVEMLNQLKDTLESIKQKPITDMMTDYDDGDDDDDDDDDDDHEYVDELGGK